MTLPNFLGIGAQKAGSSWLELQLRGHPDIYLPPWRKEVHFFDGNYDRGIEWYEKFFSDATSSDEYLAIGEITPKYIYDPEVPARIQKHIPNCKFIAILRNSVDRAYSQYGEVVLNRMETASFAEALEKYPDFFERGLYSEQIKRYYKYFPVENFLILLLERVKSQPEIVLRQVADFLSVDFDKFDLSLVKDRPNKFFLPRFRRARAWARCIMSFLYDRNLDWLVYIAKVPGLHNRIFGNLGSLPPMDPEIRAELIKRYEPDIVALEELLGEDLSSWRA